jgi:hypothetical protein
MTKIPGESMKEEKEEGKPEVVEEPRPEPAEGTQLEAVEEPQLGSDKEPRPESVEGPPLQTVEEPRPEPAEGPDTDEDREPESEETEPPKPEKEGEPDPELDLEDSIEDGLELDRMEVKPADETQEEPEEAAEEVIIEPPAPKQEDAVRPKVLALLVDYWIWVVAFLLGMSVVSAALLFVLAPKEEQRDEVKLGRRVHVVTASLGGEHYVDFNLWGPFRDAKGQEALRRGMPKIRHDLIFSGGRPEVARAIQEHDLYFLERHILEIVSSATGIPVDQLDLKGLSVTRYSDEAEVGEEG